MRSVLGRCRRSHTAAAAYTALFLALGGTAYATVTVTSEDIVDETIRSQDIAAQAVTTPDIAKSAVTVDRMHDFSVNSAKVVDNSLSGPDVANGSLTGWDVANESLTGSDLDLDVKTVEASTRESVWMNPYLKTATVECPAGNTAIAGGGRITPDDAEPGGLGMAMWDALQLVESRPLGDNKWLATAATSHPPNMDLWTLTVYARCAAL